MNLVVLCGKLTADPIGGKTQNGKTYCNFTLAVNKIYSQDKAADFIDITAWNTTAQNCMKYLAKGSQVLVKGSITVDSYNASDGTKVKKVKVLAENVEFLGRPNSQQNNSIVQTTSIQNDTDLTALANDCLPF